MEAKNLARTTQLGQTWLDQRDAVMTFERFNQHVQIGEPVRGDAALRFDREAVAVVLAAPDQRLQRLDGRIDPNVY